MICKQQLNENAKKFKLKTLSENSIRYETIYKNLLRDLRKFFSKHFIDTTAYLDHKKNSKGLVLFPVLKSYVNFNFDTGLLTALGVSLNDLTFFMGSLILPKEMIKIYADDPAQVSKIMKVYWCLYKFTFEKL